MIYLHADGPLLAYTLPTGVPAPQRTREVPGVAWSQPYAVLEHFDDDHTRCHGPMLRVIQRISSGEDVMLQEWSSALRATPWGDLLDLTGVDQVMVLRPLCDLYGASPDELMHAFAQQDRYGQRIIPESLSLEYAIVNAGREPRPADKIGWRSRARSFSWALGHPEVSSHPIAHAMGYTGTTMQRMEAHGVPWTPESPPQHIDAVNRVKAFIRHCEVAVKLALDTPQPITLDMAPGRLAFEHVRISDSIKGLRVSLPTGGNLFYRDATLDRSTGKVMFNGRPMASRRIPMEVAYTFAQDVYRATMWSMYFAQDADQHPVSHGFAEWCRANALH